jgi:hypothetical protein
MHLNAYIEAGKLVVCPRLLFSAVGLQYLVWIDPIVHILLQMKSKFFEKIFFLFMIKKTPHLKINQ